MAPWVELPRLTLSNNFGNITDPNLYSSSGRGSALSTPERVLRWLLVSKRQSWSMLEVLFDQSKSVITKDFYHCSFACAKVLGDTFLKKPDPNSLEFQQSVGSGNFTSFPNVSRAGDVTKVIMILHRCKLFP